MSGVRLSRRLTLEQVQSLPDGAGGFTAAWQEVGRVWAEVRPGPGRARVAEVARLSQVACRITVRAAPPGTARRPVAGQRFREGARIFAIRAVTERDAEGRYLTCFVEEEGLA